jgi:hypothetical protein
MLLPITLFIFFGFYGLYNTSKRAVLNNTRLDLWLQKHWKFSKLTGVVMLLVAHILSCLHYGTAAGIFVALIILMTIACLIILLFPLMVKK